MTDTSGLRVDPATGVRRAAGATLASALDPRRNSLNALRLGLAILVIVSHAWPLGGYGEDPGAGLDASNLGAWAVAGFFCISGFLITGSRVVSRSFWDYLWRRFLRIYPGFLAVLLVTAFVFAPLSVLADPGAVWSLSSGAQFVIHDIALWMTSFAPRGTLVSVPYPAWVVSLWTLSYEFACYLLIGLLVTAVRNKRAQIVTVVVLFAGATSFTVLHETVNPAVDSPLIRIARLSAFFLAGSLLYFWRDRVPVRWPYAVAAAAATVALIFSGWFQAFGGLPVAYLMLYLGLRLPLHRVGARSDVSYGMYTYGGPMQQWVVLLFGVRAIPVWLSATLAVVLTAPFAYLSFRFIERPAMQLKRLTTRKLPGGEGRRV